jgi:hypothetical protein
MGKSSVRKLSIAAALLAALISTSAQAKTFVGVLWPMFGPLPAIGLVELTAEIRTMPDVEVHTYLHQEWPDLVRDMSHLPDGTRTIVIGYSLGANATSWVVNKSKYVDLVIALQPSMLSWNPTITGHAGRIIEVYNPNPWMTFGGMGSKKLEWTAGNIEFMPNNDSHPGAQFNLEFRNMVKTEVAKMTTEPAVEIAQTQTARPVSLAYAEPAPARSFPPQLKEFGQKDLGQKDLGQKDTAQKPSASKDLAQKTVPANTPAPNTPAPVQTASLQTASLQTASLQTASLQTASLQTAGAQIAQEQVPVPQRRPQQQAQPQLQAQPAKFMAVAADFSRHQAKAWTAFLDTLSNSVNSGNLSARELTVADMMDYAKRQYDVSRKGDSLLGKQASLVGGDMIVASNIDPRRSGPTGACCTFVKAEGDLD